MHNFKKTDILLALIIGEICAWLMWLIARNLAIEVPGIAVAVPYLNYLLVVFPVLCVFGFIIAGFLSRAIPVIYQIAKFVLVGGLNFLIDMGVLNFLVFYTGISIGLTQSVFKGISFFVAVINSYFWNKFWTFKRTSAENVGKEFLQFVIVSVIGFGINLGVDYAVVNMMAPFAGIGAKTWAQIGALVAAVVALFWNFLGYKFIVFEEKKND
ncbi:MAG: GtrA family protein [Candidatus Terrybacteria bacterium]|nr:GtrA family protein [Candidatus Terrybacteria bacterium]